MAVTPYRSWGYIPPSPVHAHTPAWAGELFSGSSNSWLPFGNGRSYGDSCFNSDGTLIDTRSLDRFISFDRINGVLTAEPGVTLSTILKFIVPAGWFLPVTPGTSFVTLGGAIANDVHGKNHHCDGTFGRHITRFSLVRSSGEIRECSPDSNADLFAATIGGFGLTGVIANATVKLIPIRSSFLETRTDKFYGLDEFRALSAARASEYRYTVAWLDCAASGRNFARGVLLSANHVDYPPVSEKPVDIAPRLSIPLNFPSWVLNRYSIRAFNSVYFHRQCKRDGTTSRQHFKPFFYPLDALGQWNRVYGAGGFHQYQFVVPLDASEALENVLRRIVQSGLGSFLAVLKEFSSIQSPGLMSFPRAGYCLALDFAARGATTVRLIEAIDREVKEAGGAAYPAKDRLMSEDSFKSYFPAWETFSDLVDPQFHSDFWQRVSGQT